METKDMEVECVSYCSSLEAICDESEMFTHLESLVWSSSDADPCLSSSFSLSSSSSFSLISGESYDTMATELVNNSTNFCFGYQDDSFVSAEETSIGNNRQIQIDAEHEQMMNSSKEACTAMSVPSKAVHCAAQCNKPKARKQSAKDTQSHYAKKRRQRINERLRILQELIPNGTKVDISTMLEEAIQYVKFLHLQIKLLSSDEMWMYAPLAYNGINIKIYQNSLSQE